MGQPTVATHCCTDNPLLHCGGMITCMLNIPSATRMALGDVHDMGQCAWRGVRVGRQGGRAGDGGRAAEG